jgi:hypothetical protein
MNRRILILAIILNCVLYVPLCAQWSGFEGGMYAGVHALAYDPSAIANSPYKVDGNIVTGGLIYYGNDYDTEVSGASLQSSGIFKQLDKILSVDRSTTVSFFNGMFPSAMYSINDRMGVAFTMNMRGYVLSNTSSAVIRKILLNDLDDLNGQEYVNEFVRGYTHIWVDYKFSYGTVLLNSGDHLLKLGVSAKMIQGIASGKMEIDDFSFKVTGDLLEYANFDADILYNDDLDKLTKGKSMTFKGRTGGAADIGLSYEYRPESYRLNETMGYKLRTGITVNDLGAVRYKPSKSSASFTGGVEDLSLDFLQEITSMEALMDSLENIFNYEEEQAGNYTTRTPIGLNIYLDYNLGKNFYLNISNNYVMLNMAVKKTDGLKNIYRLRAIPRYEDKSFGAYLPITYDNVSGFNIGTSLRWKAFIIGSENILTTWFYPRDERNLNIYLAVKFPLLDLQFRDVGHKRRARKAAEQTGS